MKVHKRNWNNCCGAATLEGFITYPQPVYDKQTDRFLSHTDDFGYYRNDKKKLVPCASLEKGIETIEGAVVGIKRGYASICTAVLNDRQKRVWGKHLTKAGFALTRSFYNNNSGSHIHWYEVVRRQNIVPKGESR